MPVAKEQFASGSVDARHCPQQVVSMPIPTDADAVWLSISSGPVAAQNRDRPLLVAGETTFFSGRAVKVRPAPFGLRRDLQPRQTLSPVDC